VKAHDPWDDADHLRHERRKIPCPQCGVAWMADTSQMCTTCQAEIRAARQEREWREKHIPVMLRRHRRVVEISILGHLSPLVALNVARGEWGE
jgi:hypothetical protein